MRRGAGRADPCHPCIRCMRRAVGRAVRCHPFVRRIPVRADGPPPGHGCAGCMGDDPTAGPSPITRPPTRSRMRRHASMTPTGDDDPFLACTPRMADSGQPAARPSEGRSHARPARVSVGPTRSPPIWPGAPFVPCISATRSAPHRGKVCARGAAAGRHLPSGRRARAGSAWPSRRSSRPSSGVAAKTALCPRQGPAGVGRRAGASAVLRRRRCAKQGTTAKRSAAGGSGPSERALQRGAAIRGRRAPTRPLHRKEAHAQGSTRREASRADERPTPLRVVPRARGPGPARTRRPPPERDVVRRPRAGTQGGGRWRRHPGSG
jgi:hypothetical protein